MGSFLANRDCFPAITVAPSGGGGISHFVGAGMFEIDRLFARPSIEHQIETENPVLEREGDDGE